MWTVPNHFLESAAATWGVLPPSPALGQSIMHRGVGSAAPQLPAGRKEPESPLSLGPTLCMSSRDIRAHLCSVLWVLLGPLPKALPDLGRDWAHLQPEPVSVLTFGGVSPPSPPPPPPPDSGYCESGTLEDDHLCCCARPRTWKSMPSVEPGFMQLGVDMLFLLLPLPLSRQDFLMNHSLPAYVWRTLTRTR